MYDDEDENILELWKDTWRTGTAGHPESPLMLYNTFISNQTDGTTKNWWH
jgi:hypothetical protein